MKHAATALTGLALICGWAGTLPAQEDKKDPKANDAIVPIHRGEQGPWAERHKGFLKRAQQGDVDLLFLGDSITQGWNDNETWKRHYGPRKAANFGIGGDRTQHVLWRIRNGELEGITPKAVVLMIGTNNMGSNTPDQIAEGVKAIVTDLREKLPKAKILLLGIFPRDAKADSPVRQRVNQTNEKIAGLASDPMVTYLDIGPKFLESDGTLTKEVMPDLLHLSPRGYRIWADSIEPTLWKLLDEPEAGK